MIKLSTRIFAWVWVVGIALLLFNLILMGCDNGALIPYLLPVALLEAAWVMLLERPLIGWWMLVPLQTVGLGLVVYVMKHTSYGSNIWMESDLLLLAVVTVPLLVLVCDSPWRWGRVRESGQSSA